VSRTYNEGTGRAYFCEPAAANGAKDLWITKYGAIQERNSAANGKPAPIGSFGFWGVSVYNGNALNNYYLPAPGECPPWEIPG
jgi:hypothetical protein